MTPCLYSYRRFGEACRLNLDGLSRTLRTFRRVRFSREKRLLPWLMSVRPFILPHVIVRLPLDGFPWNLILGGGVYVNLSRHLNLVKIRGYIGHSTRRPKYVLLFPATFKSSYFCVTRTPPVLLHPTLLLTFFLQKTNKMQMCRIIYRPLNALHVSSDIIAHHHQEHQNCIYSFWLYACGSSAADSNRRPTGV
jgi:hypothetical protein